MPSVRAVAGILVVLAAAPAARAGIIAGFDTTSATSHATYDIYSGGYTTAPIRNAAPEFIAANYNLTGVGWDVNHLERSVTMISPQYFIMAAHVTEPLPNTPPSQVSFVSADNVKRTYTVASTRAVPTTTFNGASVNLSSDLLVGKLAAPIPAGDGIGFFPIAADSSANILPVTRAFVGLPVLCVGFNNQYVTPGGSISTHVGRDSVTSPPRLDVDDPKHATVVYDMRFNGTSGDFLAITGDSGAPTFGIIGNRLALVGYHYDSDFFSNSVDAFLPYYIPQLNAEMAGSGYSVTLLPLPEPSSLLLLAAPVAGAVWRSRRRSRP